MWKGPREALEEIMVLIGQNPVNLTFTISCSQSQITFLDVQILLTQENLLVIYIGSQWRITQF